MSVSLSRLNIPITVLVSVCSCSANASDIFTTAEISVFFTNVPANVSHESSKTQMRVFMCKSIDNLFGMCYNNVNSIATKRGKQMKMPKKFILTAVTAAVIMTGCGPVNQNDESSQPADTSSENAVTTSVSSVEKSDEEIEIRSSDEVSGAAVKAENAGPDGAELRAALPLEQAKKLYSTAAETVNNAPEADKPSVESKASVGFVLKDDSKLILAAYDNDVFAWAQENGEVKYFSADSQTAKAMRKDIYAAAALGPVFKSPDFTISDETSEDSDMLVNAMNSSVDGFDEYIYIYLDEEKYFFGNVERGGDIFYFSSIVSEKTDVEIQGSYYYQNYDFYEFIEDRQGRYCRTDETDVWYEAASYDGAWDINSLPVRISLEAEYTGKFNIEFDGQNYTCEHWSSDSSEWYVLFDSSEKIKCAWNASADGLTLIHSYMIQEADTENLSEIADHAREKLDTSQQTELSESEQKKADNEASDILEYQLFDLSGEIVKGEKIEDPHVVSDWREYFKSNQTYSMEYYMVGAGRLEHHIYTADESNYYIRWDITDHTDDYNGGSEEICIGDTCYQSYYDIDEYDSRTYDYFAKDEYYQMIIPMPFDPEDDVSFVEAYNVTIDGESYQCEEWTSDLHDFVVYSRDGEIVGYKTDFYREPVVYTVKKFTKECDSSLLTVPENASPYNYID